MEKELLKYGQKIPCTIEVLTPTHVGSGIKLLQGFDFFNDRGTIKKITQKELEDYLKENPEDINQFGNPNFSPESLLRKIQGGKEYYINVHAREIYEFERNGSGLPYLPGSSMKGAVRTAILSHRFLESNDTEKNQLLGLIDRNEKFASERLLEKLFGDKPNNNLFKTLSMFDSYFEENDLNLYLIYILSLSNKEATRYLWKNMRKGKDERNQELPQKATPLLIEMLNPGSKANFSIKVDSFYFENEDARRNLKIKGIKSTELIDIINKYSLMQLDSELSFYKNLNQNGNLETVINELSEIKSEIEKKAENQAIMRMSWGVSWKFMTGNFITQEQIIELKSKFKYKMGKDGFIFPKTRKIIFEEDTASHTPGWVKIKLFDKIEKSEKKSKAEDEKSAKIESKNVTSDPMEALKDKFKVTKK